jgi:amidase
LHADCIAAVDNVAQLLTSLGHIVEESHPSALDEHKYVEHFNTIVACHTLETFGLLAQLVGRPITQDDVELWTWTFAERARRVSAAEYLAAVHWVQVWTRRVAQWWADGFDLLLTPTIAEPPPPLGTLVASPENPSRGWDRLLRLSKKAFAPGRFFTAHSLFASCWSDRSRRSSPVSSTPWGTSLTGALSRG